MAESSPMHLVPEGNQFEMPIAIFVFNRPTETARVFARIRAVRPKTLRVICDYAREGKSGEGAAVAEVLQVFQGIDWPCDVQYNIAERNLGCRMRLQSGLDWLFDEFPEVIILEDDCLPEPTFFDFMRDKLHEFRENPNVGLVSGTNFQPLPRSRSTGHYFSELPHIWGWGSWARVWKNYEPDAASWATEDQATLLRRVFHYRIYRKAWQEILDNINVVNTWDYQLCFTLWRHKQLCVVPKVNLVTNIGLNEGGTHTRAASAHFQNRTGVYVRPELSRRSILQRKSRIRDFLELTVFRVHAARQMKMSELIQKALRLHS